MAKYFSVWIKNKTRQLKINQEKREVKKKREIVKLMYKR